MQSSLGNFSRRGGCAAGSRTPFPLFAELRMSAIHTPGLSGLLLTGLLLAVLALPSACKLYAELNAGVLTLTFCDVSFRQVTELPLPDELRVSARFVARPR